MITNIRFQRNREGKDLNMNLSKKILILVDDDDNFLIQIDKNHDYHSMDVMKIKHLLQEYGYDVQKCSFSKLDLKADYKGVFVIYHICEDLFVLYKSYVEDIINFLRRQGAIILPNCDYARAHHNKVYMEMLRSEFKDADLKTIQTSFFGNAKEALNASNEMEYPVVIKPASGAGSWGVSLAYDAKEYQMKINKICGGFFYRDCIDFAKKAVKLVLNKVGIKKYYIDNCFSKIIVQTFIPNLAGDYKVLYFGGKYYTLKRLNRDNDFRASGSGKLFFVPDEEICGLLDFAKKAVHEIDFSMIGLDIGFDGQKYHLLEFQMVHMGPYTLTLSDFYHVESENGWKKIITKSDLEEEFSRCIDYQIKKKNKI